MKIGRKYNKKENKVWGKSTYPQSPQHMLLEGDIKCMYSLFVLLPFPWGLVLLH
jgi:hypothetical protein